MLEGNEEVVQLQLRAGNISSGRPAGQCAKEQKKRDASEQSTEEAPSSEEVEVAPRRFGGTMHAAGLGLPDAEEQLVVAAAGGVDGAREGGDGGACAEEGEGLARDDEQDRADRHRGVILQHVPDEQDGPPLRYGRCRFP